jgi:two-component system OmpR family response regulator
LAPQPAEQLEMRKFSHMAKKFPALRVLVVEDELLIRWSIAETLAQTGHTVIEAEDGVSAVQALMAPAAPFDAVLLDYRLPDSDDLSLLANIRQLSPHSAVILMTAYGTPEIITSALDLGVCQVLNKPFEMHELEGLLLKACGSRP